MIYKHDYQRMALDIDRMMITQCGNDYHDYSDNKLACIYIKWAEEHCPERLQAETDNGRIYVHIDERITECEKEKWKIWNKMRGPSRSVLPTLRRKSVSPEKITRSFSIT